MIRQSRSRNGVSPLKSERELWLEAVRSTNSAEHGCVDVHFRVANRFRLTEHELADDWAIERIALALFVSLRFCLLRRRIGIHASLRALAASLLLFAAFSAPLVTSATCIWIVAVAAFAWSERTPVPSEVSRAGGVLLLEGRSSRRRLGLARLGHVRLTRHTL